MMFSHGAVVSVKWTWNGGFFANHLFALGVCAWRSFNDEIGLECPSRLTLEPLEELEPLLMTVARHAFGDSQFRRALRWQRQCGRSVSLRNHESWCRNDRA